MTRKHYLEIMAFALNVWLTSPKRRPEAERIMDLVEDHIGHLAWRPPASRIVKRKPLTHTPGA